MSTAPSIDYALLSGGSMFNAGVPLDSQIVIPKSTPSPSSRPSAEKTELLEIILSIPGLLNPVLITLLKSRLALSNSCKSLAGFICELEDYLIILLCTNTSSVPILFDPNSG
jgi:hypothetical protein